MKNAIKLVLVVFAISNVFSVTAQDSLFRNYLQISPRVGYDFPTYNNNTPYIDYDGGLELGISVDYYWKWIGIGADFDYIKNQPESTYPTANLVNTSGISLTSFDLTEEKITRVFYGLGPDFKYQNKDERFTAELNTRVGLASIKGGRTLLQETTTSNSDVINFHAGYNQQNVLSLKGQVRFTYFLNKPKTIGVHLGAYFLTHYNVEDVVESGRSAEYWPYTIVEGNDPPTLDKEGSLTRKTPCNCNIYSTGVFAGLSFRFTQKQKTRLVKYALVVTAKDKFSGVILPNTDVAIKDIIGNVVKTGTTNSYGVIVFDDINPDSYVIEGVLYNVDLEGTTVQKNEFEPNETLQKEILYTDMNFILKGNVVVCNTSTPIPDVSVALNNLKQAEQKNTLTDNDGLFMFHVKQQSDYSIYGKKGQYFSQTESVSTNNYDRSATLFVMLEICMEKADCGKAIKLQNIHYDLDKDFIREDAKPELNRLAQFMTDNPDINIELSSHTDSRASSSYNQNLSQRRADRAVDYLISLGVSGSRLIGTGYGETKLLNECADGVQCSEEKHQENRRTEFKVICPE